MKRKQKSLMHYAFGGEGGNEPTKKKAPYVSPEDLKAFGNWAGTTDTKLISKKLMDLGLVGANQMVFENQDTSSSDAIKKKNQSDWKPAAINDIVSNARKYNLRTPEELEANRKLLYGNSAWKDSIDDPRLANVNPNFWDVIDNQIIPQQWKTYDKSLNDASTTKKAMGGTASQSGKWNGLISEAPQILDMIMSLTGNNSYSRQPIVNTSAVNNMATPYSGMAWGGSIDDLDEGEMLQLQQLADANGVEPEEMYDMIMQQQGQQQDDNTDDNQDEEVNPDEEEDDSDEDDNEDDIDKYAYGGFKINPKHKGWCTPMTKSTCTGKRRQFAINAKHHFKKQHAMGGTAKINVEGDEVLDKPGERGITKIHGDDHEQGGENRLVPHGTKIYSKRLAIEGKTMADRKVAREGRMKKLEKLLNTNPDSNLLRNTVKRTSETIHNEDMQDMALQNAANKIYAVPQEEDDEKAMGGYAYGGYPMKYAFGGSDIDDFEDVPPMYNSTGYINPNIPGFSRRSYSSDAPKLPGELTTGDYIGLAGTAFGSIAPILNTLADKRHTAPVVNRYASVGANALTTNQGEEGYVAGMRTNAYTDLDTKANTSYKRNANSAMDVNVLRGLDAATDMATNKGRNDINDEFSKEMLAILGNREKLQNTRDQYVAYGQTGADDRNAANTDNYYSNMGANISNISRGVQATGRNLNIAHKNTVDANLISQLSRYGLEFDENGNLINKQN